MSGKSRLRNWARRYNNPLDVRVTRPATFLPDIRTLRDWATLGREVREATFRRAMNELMRQNHIEDNARGSEETWS